MTLEIQRIRADLIEVYKVINKMENVDEELLFKRHSEGSTAHGTMKLEAIVSNWKLEDSD